jgi:hypothetical protein
MARASGLWIAVGGGALVDDIAASIERDGQFTTTVAVSDVKPRTAEIVIVSMYGSDPMYVGISQAGRRVATGQKTIAISHLKELDRLSNEQIRARLPNRLATRFHPPSAGAYRPTPRLWEEILNIAATSLPDNALHDLRTVIDDADVLQDWIEGGLEVLERDAIASALQTWGGTIVRKRILRNVVPAGGAPVASFLSRLRNVSVREDPQINHDQGVFPGMKIARRDIVGSVVLSSGRDHLTILNCNRQPLEQTLGVDLIYYNHYFDSFVLVQYKRMVDEQYGPVYRPSRDASHEKELKRMSYVESALLKAEQGKADAMKSYRLSTRAFYLKLCEAKAKAALDPGMASGMYVPLGLWRELIKTQTVRGPGGGIAVNWDNCWRRFSNIEFASLLRHGWIGSAGGQSKLLAKIIEGVLSGRRMLILAGSGGGKPSRDWRRDTMGRFAADDDPAGAI